MFQMEHKESAGAWGRYTARVVGLNDPGQDPEAYPHIHSVLARRIRGGEYPAGAKLPTPTELADEFGCGRDAAARALRALQRDGLAMRVLRRGYVSSGPDAHPG
jgi:DNA-binding GntR family transcriptional regulator